MNKSFAVSLIAGALMVSSAAVTKVVTPTAKMADREARFELGDIVPVRFGDWEVDSTIAPLQVDPETQAKLDKIYNQTLSRTYVNRDGERIMLSIAYGGDQSDNMSVHKPEICYTAQGFEVKDQLDLNMKTAYGELPVRRLYAINGARHEPITYWITIGDKVTPSGTTLKLQQLRYGFSGTVPDGVLVRVSSINTDTSAAYVLQQKFVGELLHSLNPNGRRRLIGVTGT